MKLTNLILLIAALVGSLSAQTLAVPPPGEPHSIEGPNQSRVFVLKYADPRNVANVLAVFGYGIKADRDMHVVAVSAPAQVMAAIQEAVTRLDVPAAAPKDIDLVVYMMVASEQPNAAAELPAELQPVVAEMKRIFSYRNYRLLDSILLRTQPNNRASANGVIGTSDRTPYNFTVTPTAVTDDPKGRLVRLDNLNLSLHLPGDRVAGIQTEITVREGQRVVVGKSNMGTDQSLILVVTVKVTD